MGRIDDFLVSQVTPHLVAGESIQICAHAREPSSFNLVGAPTRNEPWLLVATNLRLFMFKTSVSGMWDNQPKPEARDAKVFPFDEMASVSSKVMHYGQAVPGGPAKMFLLTPHPQFGPARGEPVRFDLYAVAEGLDQQARFCREFPEWLAQQIASGAYRMDPARYQATLAQAEQQRQQQMAALQERNRAAAARAAAFQRTAGKAARPVAAAVVWLAGFLGFGLLAAIGSDKISWYEKERITCETTIASMKKAAEALDDGELPEKCAETAETCTRWCDHGATFAAGWAGGGKTPKQRGFRIFKNPGGEDWQCVPAKVLTTSMAGEKKQLEFIASEVTVGWAKLVGGAAGALAWLGVGVGGLVWWRRRAAQAPAPAQSGAQRP
jgi:hypothetical protein